MRKRRNDNDSDTYAVDIGEVRVTVSTDGLNASIVATSIRGGRLSITCERRRLAAYLADLIGVLTKPKR